MMTVCPACSIRTETRRRLSRGSSDVHVSQLQAMEGTPVDVPVPRKVSFICQFEQDYLTLGFELSALCFDVVSEQLID